jgi:exosortase A-associated hydrolase 2
VQPEVFFLPDIQPHGDQRFCLFYQAKGNTTLGLVLYIHPFAEEMNKARRMAALQSRALAQAGYDVLQIDLLGCGDSSGDFGDATWQRWVQDVVQSSRWLRSRASAHAISPENKAPLWLWGLRAGCLLAVDAAQHLDEPCHFLFWQPPSSGKPLLQQFMRLKIAGDMLGGQGKSVMDGMRKQWADGAAVEIAGYVLSPELAQGLEQATLATPVDNTAIRRLEWFEVSTRETASFSPVSTKTQEQWQEAGFKVCGHIVNGPSFWQTSEIEIAPALIAATTTAIASLAPVPV